MAITPQARAEGNRYFAGKNITLRGQVFPQGAEIPADLARSLMRLDSLITTRRVVVLSDAHPVKGWQRRLLERNGAIAPKEAPAPPPPPAPKPVKKAAAKKTAKKTVKKAPATGG